MYSPTQEVDPKDIQCPFLYCSYKTNNITSYSVHCQKHPADRFDNIKQFNCKYGGVLYVATTSVRICITCREPVRSDCHTRTTVVEQRKVINIPKTGVTRPCNYPKCAYCCKYRYWGKVRDIEPADERPSRIPIAVRAPTPDQTPAKERQTVPTTSIQPASPANSDTHHQVIVCHEKPRKRIEASKKSRASRIPVLTRGSGSESDGQTAPKQPRRSTRYTRARRIINSETGTEESD